MVDTGVNEVSTVWAVRVMHLGNPWRAAERMRLAGGFLTSRGNIGSLPCPHSMLRRPHSGQTVQRRIWWGTRERAPGAHPPGRMRNGRGDHARRSDGLRDRGYLCAEPAEAVRGAPLFRRRRDAVCRRRGRLDRQCALRDDGRARRDGSRPLARRPREGLRRRAVVHRSGRARRRPRVRAERHALLHVLSVSEPRAAPARDRRRRVGARPPRDLQRRGPHLLAASDRSRDRLRTPAGLDGHRPERLRGSARRDRDPGALRAPAERDSDALREALSRGPPSGGRRGRHRHPVRAGRRLRRRSPLYELRRQGALARRDRSCDRPARRGSQHADRIPLRRRVCGEAVRSRVRSRPPRLAVPQHVG